MLKLILFVAVILIGYNSFGQNKDSLVNTILNAKPAKVVRSDYMGGRFVTLTYNTGHSLSIAHYKEGSPFTGMPWYFGGMEPHYIAILMNGDKKENRLKAETYERLKKLYWKYLKS